MDVEESDEGIKSLFNESRYIKDSIFDSIFEIPSDYEDESLNSDIEKYVSATKDKMRGKGIASTKKGDGLLVKKPVLMVKKKGQTRMVVRDQAPVLNQSKPLDPLGHLERELILQIWILLNWK